MYTEYQLILEFLYREILSEWYNEDMDYETANNLILELKNCWIKNSHTFGRKIPDYLLVETLSHYSQAYDVLRMFGKEGDLEKVAIAQMQLRDIDDIEGKKEFSKLLENIFPRSI